MVAIPKQYALYGLLLLVAAVVLVFVVSKSDGKATGGTVWSDTEQKYIPPSERDCKSRKKFEIDADALNVENSGITDNNLTTDINDLSNKFRTFATNVMNQTEKNMQNMIRKTTKDRKEFIKNILDELIELKSVKEIITLFTTFHIHIMTLKKDIDNNKNNLKKITKIITDAGIEGCEQDVMTKLTNKKNKIEIAIKNAENLIENSKIKLQNSTFDSTNLFNFYNKYQVIFDDSIEFVSVSKGWGATMYNFIMSSIFIGLIAIGLAILVGVYVGRKYSWPWGVGAFVAVVVVEAGLYLLYYFTSLPEKIYTFSASTRTYASNLLGKHQISPLY